MFEHYANAFDTVEINKTFYRLPEKNTLAAWSAQAPRGFLYVVKASRIRTHMKKLKDPEEPLGRLFSRMQPLSDHLGPVLYQLPLVGSSTVIGWSTSCKRCRRP